MESMPLVAGPLRMVFDPKLAFLRHVFCGDAEVVRGIYVAVRDKSWNTVPFEVLDLQIDAKRDHFSLSWMARCTSDEIAFEWRGVVVGSRKGRIVYEFDGRALKSFLKNRIGICVLHPIRECAGQQCRVEHFDGTITDAIFPYWISPHQPFKNIRSIQHSVCTDVGVKITFDGDIFEMEDQRNWTDASFKTYSPPLEQPYPLQMKAGDRVNQSTTIEIQIVESTVTDTPLAVGDCLNQSALPNDEVRISIDWNASRPVPPVGISMAHFAGVRPCAAVISRLKEIRLDHLRVDLRLTSEVWQARLQSALQLANQIDVQLELALFCDSTQDPAWRDCLEQLAGQRHQIGRWLILPANMKTTPNELASESYRELLALDATIPVAFGTDGNFADLNRNRPILPEKSLVCYSLHPQMHLSDKVSLCETLQGQPATVDSAYEIFQREVVISPITLLPRFNWSDRLLADHRGDFEPPIDSRQSTGFIAAWTVGTLSRLAAHPRLASITFYETHGPRGIMDSVGNPYATYSVFSWMSSYQRICAATSSHPLDVVSLALIRDDGSHGLIVGNMSRCDRTIVVESTDGRGGLLKMKSESAKHIAHGGLK